MLSTFAVTIFRGELMSNTIVRAAGAHLETLLAGMPAGGGATRHPQSATRDARVLTEYLLHASAAASETIPEAGHAHRALQSLKGDLAHGPVSGIDHGPARDALAAIIKWGDAIAG